MLFTPNCSVKCREYVCDCEYILCDDEGDEDIDQNQQIFDFVDVALCMSLFTGNPAKPLCFVKVTEKNCNQRHKGYVQSLYSYQWIVLRGELLETHEIKNSKQQKIPNPSDLCIIPPPWRRMWYLHRDRQRFSVERKYL